MGERHKQFGNFGDKANNMPLLGVETRLVSFPVRIIFYVDVMCNRKICTYHSGPIAIKENILSFVCATSEGKQGLEGRIGSYFSWILVLCGNC